MTATAAHPRTAADRIDRHNPEDRLRHRVFGRNPLGLLFSAPYLVFVIAVFAVPVVYAV